jgi:4,5-DOPA dioxygenase extradiol
MVNTHPRTIHDFGGFPGALYEIEYPAPGDPVLARRVRQILAPISVELSEHWGFDHGTWTVLRHMYPDADVPIVQLSIDGSKAPQYHYEVGRRLASLREEGVLIAGSGNLVHNLMAYRGDSAAAPPFDWAVRFDAWAREAIEAKHFEELVKFPQLGRDAALSNPTPEHYLPLLYVAGASGADESLAFPVEGIVGSSVSMLTVQIGA